ncbi:glycoside hydrolase family 1 protein, partial [Kineococcus glutinatus]|uniref:glycoside hydrolase family 1 protein n=1 Tax=Kineococcus glutinatus TaxID=1070872 RepID=UPI0031EFA7F0
ALAAVHHLNLAHGLGAAAVRRTAPNARVALTLNLAWVRTDGTSDADLDAVRRVDGLQNRVFLDPVLKGAYPADVLIDTAAVSNWSFVLDGDLELIKQPLDVLGINYYSPTVVRAWDGSSPREEADGHGASAHSPWVASASLVEFPEQPGAKTAMGWSIDARGMRELLVRMHTEHPGLELVVTENGAAYPDEVTADGAVHDADRVEYLRAHLGAVLDAIEAGAPVTGYFLWSFLDNFEWGYGYSKRFGIVHVDYGTQQRTPKDSAHWYSRVIGA